MRIELTQQSGLEVDRLSAADMTPAMAAQYLSASIHIRGFWEMLRRYAPVGDLRDRVSRAVSGRRMIPNPWLAGCETGSKAKIRPPAGRICSASPLPWDWTRNRPPACWAYAQTTASTTATAGN